jgi:hypothetical protein
MDAPPALRRLLSIHLRRVDEEQSHPSDQPRWNVYGKLFQDNQRFL